MPPHPSPAWLLHSIGHASFPSDATVQTPIGTISHVLGGMLLQLGCWASNSSCLGLGSSKTGPWWHPRHAASLALPSGCVGAAAAHTGTHRGTG